MLPPSSSVSYYLSLLFFGVKIISSSNPGKSAVGKSLSSEASLKEELSAPPFGVASSSSSNVGFGILTGGYKLLVALLYVYSNSLLSI